MHCEHAERLIPLFAGDDLSAAEQRDVAAHVSGCPACAELAADYRDSLDAARDATAPSFDDAFYRSIRTSVLAEIDAAPRPARRWRPLAIAATIAAAALAAALAVQTLSTRPVPAEPPRVVDAGKPAPAEEGIAPAPPAPEVAREVPRRRPSPRRRPAAPRMASAKPSDTKDMMRIEYQTADPNVRVIWFVPQGSPAPTRDDKSGA